MRLVSMFASAAIFIGTPAFAETVSVPGTADLYLAGQPSGTSCCAGDSAPAESPVLTSLTLTPGEYLTFSTIGGATYEPGAVFSTADGELSRTYNLEADYGTGISGPTDIHLAGLAGVFLGQSQPSGPAPAQLDGTNFTTLTPAIGQMFYIGDGLTGTGTGDVQTFFVPAGATRLFLGITDDGGYFDNSGVIDATITTHLVSAAPEPGTWALMFGGLAMIGGMLRIANARRRENEVAGIATA